MALPKLMVPTYDLEVPSNGTKIQYRPFLVREEKLLLMASEGDDEKVMAKALREIVEHCVLTKLNINELTIYDLEYIFLQLRARSVGEISDLRYVCQNNIGKSKKTEKKCLAPIKISLDLSTIEVQKDEKHDGHIKLTDTIGIILKDPSVALIEKYGVRDIESVENLFDVIADCVDHVYSGEQIIKDYKKEELDEFIGSLTQQQFEGVKTFFETVPKLHHTVSFKCDKCKNESSVELRGLTDFFM